MNPIAFGRVGSQLMGMYHAPDRELALASGVVLCNPFGYEAMCVHRTYRHLAERLAMAGFDVLRFDYHGTGDSSGRMDEPNRVRAWLDSIGAAVEELRAIAGVTSVNLFGVRLGATLAVLAAAERSDIRDLVLWAPAVSGRAYVRELRALQMLKGDGRGGEGTEGPFETATLGEVSALSLLSQRGPVSVRALILARDDLPTDGKQIASHLQECGVETDLRIEPGYMRMMEHPETSVVPAATLDGIVAWLRPNESALARPPIGRATSRVLTVWGQAPRRPVHEEALSFGDGNRLFGILTEAEDAPSGRTAVVFLNAGANHRVGPNRLYVLLARELAGRGHLAFRVDVSGIGDGAVAPGRTENEVYSKDSVADVRAAMTFLTRIRGVQRFILVGICSGGFLAFHTSAEDTRVAGQIVINPQTFEWKKGDSLRLSVRQGYKSTRFYLHELWHPSVWTRALHGKLDVRGVAGALRRRTAVRATTRLMGLMARWRGLPEPRTEVERVLREVSGRGVQSLFVFSSNDGGLDMIEQHLGSGARNMQEHAGFRLEVVDGADHTFTQKNAQARLEAMIARFVESTGLDRQDPRGRTPGRARDSHTPGP